MRNVNPLFFLLCCIAGIIIPYSVLVPALFESGFDIAHFVGLAFSNRMSAFFTLDVLISSLLIIGLGWFWFPGRAAIGVMVLTVIAGVAAGLSLFLYYVSKGKIVHHLKPISRQLKQSIR